jgi:putative membrane protein
MGPDGMAAASRPTPNAPAPEGSCAVPHPTPPPTDATPASDSGPAATGTPADGARPPRRALPAAALLAVIAGTALSAWRPHDWPTWLLETVWVLAGVPLAVATRRRFPLTTLLCCLLAVHALVLALGGHYTYAQVPAGDWLGDRLGWERNPYDRFGHLMQGFVPAVLVRELLSRTSPLRGSRWLAPLTVCACLAFSAVFELFEWVAALTGGASADAFLATQGDTWDTQWDMFCALVGAVVSLLTLGRLHDRQLARLQGQ